MLGEALMMQISWCLVESSLWMPQLAFLTPNKTLNMARLAGFQPMAGGPSIILGPSFPLCKDHGCLAASMPPALTW